MARVHVLLPVHNRRETTRRFVECLLAQTHTDHRMILIDDGSRDGTADMVLEAIPNAAVIRGKGDWWWAGSLQQGLDWLKNVQPDDNDIVLFINDDVAFDPDFLKTGSELVGEFPQSLLLARIQDPVSGLARESGVHADVGRMRFAVAESPEAINCLSTRGLFVRWEVARRLGDFHPKVLPHYLSDYEWTMRAAKYKIRLWTDERLVIALTNHDRSGYLDLGGVKGIGEYLKLMFSKKSHLNPVYRSAFVFLASAWPVIPFGLVRVWGQVFKGLCKRALAP